MPRSFICFLFIFSLLFMGVESAVDSMDGEHQHGDDYAHVLDSDNSIVLDADDDDGHCCHGHTGSIAGHITLLNCDMTRQLFSFYQPHFFNYSQAPPTPPPNV